MSRKGSSKILTFSVPHVFKALQILDQERFVSRSTLCRVLHIGEGAVKTLILHLKSEGLVDTMRAGTFLTPNGVQFAKALIDKIPNECVVDSHLFETKYNHAVLVRDGAHLIKTGVEQRDYAIPFGVSVVLTLVYRDGRLLFPGESQGTLEDSSVMDELLNLKPLENDIIIMTSANDPFAAEMAVKNSALLTLQ